MTYAASNDNLIFDWAPHLDRLKRETDIATAERRPDPWAQAEAECWLDLIDAEIEAQRALPQSRPEVAAGLRQLAGWRADMIAIVRRLEVLGSSGSGGAPLRASHSDSDREIAA
jgi:hypothetical protein